MSIRSSGRLAAMALASLLAWGCTTSGDNRRMLDASKSAVAGLPAFDVTRPAAASGVYGQVERHQGLRVLRVWGTAEERGYAHGYLLAKDIHAMMSDEFAARFADSPQLLAQARMALPRLIEYPDDFSDELDALWRGLMARNVSRYMPKLDRDFDKTDLLVINAFDVFGLMGCSSFTVWGDAAVGGGVLTARNFDWPFTGDHMLDQCLLIVQMPKNARGTASVAWPGYIGTVTGISSDGVAAYLHVGNAQPSLPEPSSRPSAIAARMILESSANGARRLTEAKELVEYTSPVVGYLTHVVLPEEVLEGQPVAVFETNASDTVLGNPPAGPFVVTNHFRTRTDGRKASQDSKSRAVELRKGISGCIAVDDLAVDPDEAWQILQTVERGGDQEFGTLHSLVFRHHPWHFELRIASHEDGELVGAPSSPQRYRLSRGQVFGDTGLLR